MVFLQAYLKLLRESLRHGKVAAAAAVDLANTCEDAVRYSPASVPLWLFFIERSASVPAALQLCERALVAITSGMCIHCSLFFFLCV